MPKEARNVGWVQLGTKPGEVGNDVLTGHVDNKTGPPVFFDLGHLDSAEVVTVSIENQKSYDLEVQKVESSSSNEAPMEKVFGTCFHVGLNLVTCTGTFDRIDEERIVVYTNLQSK
ncbi:MAG: class F sortase [Anaerobacillus sp.]